LYYTRFVANVDWSFTENHVRQRHGVEIAWIAEALNDPEALVLNPDPASRSGRSIRTIGYSISAKRLLTVITVEEDGKIYGVNGWKSSNIDVRRYKEEE
jgi:uncharacterized DUF497 family protein